MSVSKLLLLVPVLLGFPALISHSAAHDLSTETIGSVIELENNMCGDQDAFFRIDTTRGQSRTIRLEPGRLFSIFVGKGDKMNVRCGAPPENAPTDYIQIEHNHVS